MYSDNSTKKFSKEDHAISDPLSRQYAVEALQQIDPKFHLVTPLTEQKEEYKKWDFTIMYGDKPITVETEHKIVWVSTDGTFKVRLKNDSIRAFNTIDVPTRKWESEADLFIMFNAEFNVLALTEMKNVLEANTTTKSTTVTRGEIFFSVSLDKFRFYCKMNGVWTKV